MEVEEKADVGADDAAALKEENAWKQIAKKRIKASAFDEEVAAAAVLPK